MKNIPSAPKTRAILKALVNGEKLTVGKALQKYHCYALSQRIGDLKRLGWKIRDRWLVTEDSRVKEYSL